jgi:hypothetical protein
MISENQRDEFEVIWVPSTILILKLKNGLVLVMDLFSVED